jgi:hypothetical protein
MLARPGVISRIKGTLDKAKDAAEFNYEPFITEASEHKD